MDIAELEQLVNMVRESRVGELTLRRNDERVTIRRAAGVTAPSVSLAKGEYDYPYAAQYAEIVDEDTDEIAIDDQPVLVTAPLVGVFGHVKPIVVLNTRVVEGQVIGVIEAMKILTEIKSPATGTIVDLFIEGGHPVEFGQALFEIRVSS